MYVSLAVQHQGVCADDPFTNCSRMAKLVNICSDVHQAKQVCRKSCGLCALGKHLDISMICVNIYQMHLNFTKSVLQKAKQESTIYLRIHSTYKRGNIIPVCLFHAFAIISFLDYIKHPRIFLKDMVSYSENSRKRHRIIKGNSF